MQHNLTLVNNCVKVRILCMMLNLCSVKQRRERNTLQSKKHEDQFDLVTDSQTKLPPHTQKTKDRSQSPHIDQVLNIFPSSVFALLEFSVSCMLLQN
jgi:hypothetical protein